MLLLFRFYPQTYRILRAWSILKPFPIQFHQLVFCDSIFHFYPLWINRIQVQYHFTKHKELYLWFPFVVLSLCENLSKQIRWELLHLPSFPRRCRCNRQSWSLRDRLFSPHRLRLGMSDHWFSCFKYQIELNHCKMFLLV